MPVTRSALASRAASRASAGPAPTSGAISSARRCSRRTRSPWEPSLAWNVTWSSSGTRDSSRALRSRSQKWRASAKRARSTRSLPATEVAPAVRRLDVGDEAEIRRGRAVRVAESEVALVHPHRDLPHFGRQIHVRIVDTAEQRHRPFHQSRDLIKQSGIVHHLRFVGERGDPFRDDPLALRGIHQDAAVAQAVRPIRARRHREGAGRVEAVALGQIGRNESMPIVLAVAQVERHHRAIQQADDAAQRADPDEIAATAPAH